MLNNGESHRFLLILNQNQLHVIWHNLKLLVTFNQTQLSSKQNNYYLNFSNTFYFFLSSFLDNWLNIHLGENTEKKARLILHIVTYLRSV